MCVTKIFLKKTSTHRSLWSSGDVSEGEDSDFKGDGVYTPVVQMPLVLFLILKN